jgi:hypothetical protein
MICNAHSEIQYHTVFLEFKIKENVNMTNWLITTSYSVPLD